MCWISPGSLPVISLIQAPARQQTSLWYESGWHTGHSAPLRSKAGTTTTLLLLPVLAIHLVEYIVLGHPQTELLLCCHLPGPWDPRLHTHSVRAPGKAREASRGFLCLPVQGLVSISLLWGLLLLDGKRGRAPQTLAVLPSTAFLSGMEGCDSTSLLFCTLWYSSASSPPLQALPPGWAGHPPVHNACRCLSHCTPALNTRLRHPLQSGGPAARAGYSSASQGALLRLVNCEVGSG